MTAPNIVNVTTITAKVANNIPATIDPTVLLANDYASSKVCKVNMIVAANMDPVNAVNVTVAYNTLATGSGTSYPVVSTVSVPANASLVVTDKTTSFYLEEDRSIVVTSSEASKVAFTTSYEEIS